MAKIGRNELCPCGSGKKFKHCHMNEDKGNHRKEAPSFEEMVSKYNSEAILKLLGVLQLLPVNHGQEAQLEEMARLTLLQRREKDERPFASWQMLNAVIGPMGYFNDAPTNAFTENAVFTEGNYVVYPGIYVGVTEILNQITECIFLQDNDLPEAFTKDVKDGISLLLFISNIVAKEKGHTRFMYEEPEYDKITFPQYDDLIKDAGHLTFEKSWLQHICNYHKLNYGIINEFILPIGLPELNNSDPDENPVNEKPLIENNEEIILFMPTTVSNSLLQFVYRKARAHNCFDGLSRLINEKQFDNSCKAVAKMGWLATNIVLPDDEDLLPIREAVFQFDNQKFGYICFVNPATTAAVANPQKKDGLKERSEIIVQHLSKLSTDQTFQVLTLFVIAETGEDGLFSWDIPSAGNQVMAFRYSELVTIAYSEDVNRLSIWKFSKTYNRTSEMMRIMTIGGMLDAYAIYDDNNGSLIDSDKANPIGGMMMIANGSSNDFYRKVQKDIDEHGVLLITGKLVGFTKVIRPKRYAPVFKDKFDIHQHRIVIENYKMPIWVTNYQADNSEESTWAEPICEAVAYWLQRTEERLKPIINVFRFFQFEIEIVVSEELLRAKEYEVKEIDIENVSLDIEIDAPKIKLHIPFDFLYIVRLPNNNADKLLMKAALKGIAKYVVESGKEIDLTEEQIEELVEATLQPSQAKMILFADPTRNVRLDNRNLPRIRYLQESDISFILDNLVSYLPKGYVIPESIPTKEEKIKLCDDIVVVLLDKIKSKIQEFNGEDLLEWLIRMQEKCVQVREFREILIPAKIACFSNVADEVKELTGKEDNLVEMSHSVRTLVEFVAAKIPNGNKWANYDEIDELLALTSLVTTWGASSEAMRFNLSDPKMGLLPSGRIGSDKAMQKEVLEPYSNAKMHSEVFKYIEDFERTYLPKEKNGEDKETDETKVLDIAFKAEFGLTLTILSQMTGLLINEGFRNGDGWTKIEAVKMREVFETEIEGISPDEIEIFTTLLTLVTRPDINRPPAGFKSPDIFPWRYTRPLSYLRKPLVRFIDKDNTVYYYFGFRHLMMYIDNLYFLLFTGKLPERNSAEMRSWIGHILDEKGTPYRNGVRDWLRDKTDFTVIEYEVTMKPGGHFEADKNYGDIDVLAIDHLNKIVYPIECKNSVGARNVHEMKSEMDMYLGREGNEKNAKINKHIERDRWLTLNKQQLTKFGIQSPDGYKIKSFILTADEIPLPYLKNEALPMAMKSFVFLRRDGLSILDDL
jgi:hypothetical protein